MQHHKPLRIVIVGTGLGGLIAALCLRRDGHRVHLYERRATFEPKGGGIMIRPIPSKFLHQWGLGPAMKAICDAAPETLYRDGATDEIFTQSDTSANFDGNPDWGTFREDAQKVFYEHAVKYGAQVELGVAVADVDEDDDKARIVPNAPSPAPSGSTIYQVRASEEEVLADPDARALAQDGALSVWMKADGGGYVVMKCNKSLNRISGAFGIPETDDSPKMWDEHGDIEYVRTYFKDYSPSLTAFLRVAQRCGRWRLAEMPDMPQWISRGGHMALLGDSAHAMFPDAAQGFSTIVEDVGVLSHLLATHSEKGIPALLQVWQAVRQPRVNRIKAWARFNHGLFTGGRMRRLGVLVRSEKLGLR